jgi:RNA polymerase sigma factor for flagellar operon FliA
MVAERINQLPEVPRKVLAMYYYEDMRLAEIAAVFGLTESRICQIHSQAILSLRTYLTNIMNK